MLADLIAEVLADHRIGIEFIRHSRTWAWSCVCDRGLLEGRLSTPELAAMAADRHVAEQIIANWPDDLGRYRCTLGEDERLLIGEAVNPSA